MLGADDFEDGDLIDPSTVDEVSAETDVNNAVFVQSVVKNLERINVSKATKRGLQRILQSDSSFSNEQIIHCL